MPGFLHTTLRTRFILGMGIMLLPLVVLAVGAFFSLQSVIGAFNEVVQESAEEIAIVVRLQLLLRRTRTVIHDYYIPGFGDAGEPQRFFDLDRQVDKAFEQAKTGNFDRAGERTLIRSAEGE